MRSRRLQWLGHILRMGPERLLKRAVFEMLKAPQDGGDLMMDAPTHSSWRELTTYAYNREYWQTRVRRMKQPRVRVQVRMNDEVEGVRATKKPQSIPAPTSTLTPRSLAVKRYLNRDAHAAFFQPQQQSRKHHHRYNTRTRAKTKSNPKPKPLTNKQRAASSRAHWHKHHPNSPQTPRKFDPNPPPQLY